MRFNFQPTRLSKSSFVLAGLILVLALVSYFWIDQSLSLFFNNDDLLPFRKTARAITDIGLGEYSFAVAILSFIYASWAHRKWLKTWSLNYFLALVFSGVIGNIIKILVGRQRPHVSDVFDAHIFVPISFDSYYQSLPSGHAQVVFCSATMLTFLWPRKALWIYIVAGILTFSRVVVHAHFLSDIMAGGLVGHLGALWSVGLMQKYGTGQYSLSSRPS